MPRENSQTQILAYLVANKDRTHTIPEIADGIRVSRVTVWRAIHDNRSPIERLGIQHKNKARFTGGKPADEYWYDETAAQMAVMKYKAEKTAQQTIQNEVIEIPNNRNTKGLATRVTDLSGIPAEVLDHLLTESQISLPYANMTQAVSEIERYAGIMRELADKENPNPEFMRMQLIASAAQLLQRTIDMPMPKRTQQKKIEPTVVTNTEPNTEPNTDWLDEIGPTEIVIRTDVNGTRYEISKKSQHDLGWKIVGHGDRAFYLREIPNEAG